MIDEKYLAFFQMNRSTFEDQVSMIEDDFVLKNNPQFPQSQTLI